MNMLKSKNDAAFYWKHKTVVKYRIKNALNYVNFNDTYHFFSKYWPIMFHLTDINLVLKVTYSNN